MKNCAFANMFVMKITQIYNIVFISLCQHDASSLQRTGRRHGEAVRKFILDPTT